LEGSKRESIKKMPRHAQPKLDNTLLEMAVRGYEAERNRISAAMDEIRAELGQRNISRTAIAAIGSDGTAPKKRTMSASARARIAAAQRARWQAYKKAKGAAAPVQAAKPKTHKLSAAGRRAIQLATKKRWAEYHKAQKQPAKAKAKTGAAAKKVATEPMTATATV
jgi:hypothetical protein